MYGGGEGGGGGYLNTLLCEYAENLLEVDVKAVEERSLRRQVLHDQGRTEKKRHYL